MILSYANKGTKKLALGIPVKKFAGIATAARKKLTVLQAATALEDLRVTPENHLEALAGDRVGQFSIRINERYRICFRFEEHNAYDVEIADDRR